MLTFIGGLGGNRLGNFKSDINLCKVVDRHESKEETKEEKRKDVRLYGSLCIDLVCSAAKSDNIERLLYFVQKEEACAAVGISDRGRKVLL